MPVILRHILIGIIALAVQWLILGRLTLWGAYPDAVLLYLAYTSIRYGRNAGAITGFGFGFLMDAIYDTWGLHMFVKTLVGFMLGMFPDSERDSLAIRPRQAFVGGLVIAIVHNGIFVTLLALQSGARNSFLVTGLWLGSALYTAVVATLYRIFSEK
jgi:rod shape-determining protein MreD